MTTPERRAARSHLPVRIYRLGEEPPDAGPASTTAADRFEMVAALSARMLELGHGPPPSYTRATMPVRVTRLP